MTKKKTKSKLPEQQEAAEQPGTVSLDLEFHFDDDPTSEDSLHIHSIIRQLNKFRDELLRYSYEGWSPSALEHYFHVEFTPSEVSPQELDAAYAHLGISHKRKNPHPYLVPSPFQQPEIVNSHQSSQYIKDRDPEED